MAKDKKKDISARDYMPRRLSLPALRVAAKKCQGCHLYKQANQTVFGLGAKHAKLMIVGEIPGDKEDQMGKPFVGPAGIFLRKSIAATDLELEDIYFTNVVKHFKFSYFNNRKIHRTPIGSEIKACIPWLEAEIEVIAPKVILCLGATAAKSLLNRNFHLREQRGRWFKFSEHTQIMATFHPSAILRAPDDTMRQELKKFFIKDINKVVTFLEKQISG